MLLATTFPSFAQEEEGKVERLYYLDISAGYSLALPPFSNAKTDAVFLKPRSGGSMSFAFVRKITDDFGVQVEVLTTAFEVKNSDLVAASGSGGVTLSQLDVKPYRSTFFGAGAATFLPLARRLTLDVKGSVGVNLVEFAEQNFSRKLANDPPQSITVSAKRSLAPAALVGGRLRYPLGESVDIGVKVEYGISYAKFTNVQRLVNTTNSELPDVKKTVSYLNTGLTLGLRF